MESEDVKSEEVINGAFPLADVLAHQEMCAAKDISAMGSASGLRAVTSF